MPAQLNFESKETFVKINKELYGPSLYQPQPPFKIWFRESNQHFTDNVKRLFEWQSSTLSRNKLTAL